MQRRFQNTICNAKAARRVYIMPKIFTIGEALIDFIPNQKGVPLKEVSSFERAPGGAPANVAAAVAKLGGESAFIGKIGYDAFGEFLIDVLKDSKVDTSYIKRTKKAKTALAFVSLKQDSNRDFSFYRNPSADMLLNENEIEKDWFNKGDILHFCSVDLIESPVKYAHIKAINAVINKGGMISFDPNVRLPLWDSEENCKKTILDFIPLANILKVSDEELEFITGIKNEKEAINFLFQGNVKVIIYTKGSKGAALYTRNLNVEVKSEKVEVVDTTGAGDAFIGAALYKIMEEKINIDCISEAQAYSIIKFANIAAALTCSKKGAISALPNINEVKTLLK